MKVLQAISPTESKQVKSELSKLGIKCRVQVKNGTMYIYHNEVLGSFTKEEKSDIRDVLVLADFVNVCGHAYTTPKFDVYSGMAIRK